MDSQNIHRKHKGRDRDKTPAGHCGIARGNGRGRDAVKSMLSCDFGGYFDSRDVNLMSVPFPMQISYHVGDFWSQVGCNLT